MQQAYAEKAGAKANEMSNNNIVRSGASYLRLLHQLVGSRAETGENQWLPGRPTDCSHRQ